MIVRSRVLMPLLIVGCIYLYSMIREAGRLLGCVIVGNDFVVEMRNPWIFGLKVTFHQTTQYPTGMAFATLGGPLLVIVMGYLLVLLLTRYRSMLPKGISLLVCLAAYINLVLDPIYYAFIPLGRLGGEPRQVAQSLGISIGLLQVVAIALLALNIYIIKRKVIPILKETLALVQDTP